MDPLFVPEPPNRVRVILNTDAKNEAKFPEARHAVAALAVQDAVIDGECRAGRQRPIILSVIARIRHGSCETADRFLRVRSSPAQRQRPSRFTDRKAKGKAGSFTEKAAQRNSVFGI